MVGDAQDRKRWAEYYRNAERMNILRVKCVSAPSQFDREQAMRELQALSFRQISLTA